MRRISKRVREEAIRQCLVRAEEWIRGEESAPEPRPDSLAGKAMASFRRVHDFLGYEWLEAAALLRGDDEHEPWSPGDEVYLR